MIHADRDHVRAPVAFLSALVLELAVVPWLAVRASRWAGRRAARARGELGSAVADLLAGAADLHAFGAPALRHEAGGKAWPAGKATHPG